MWSDWIIVILYSVVTLLYGSVFTLLFLEIEWQNRKNMLAFLIYILLTLGLQGIIGYKGSVNMVVTCYPLIVHVPLAILCIFVYGKSILVTVSSIMMCYFLTSPRYILAEVLSALLPAESHADSIGKIIASFLLIYPIYKWIVPVMRKSFRRNVRDVMHFFIPLTILYTLSHLLYVYTDLLHTNGVLMMEIIFSLFFLFMFYYLQEYFLSMDEKFQEEKKNQILTLSTEGLKKQLDIIQESNEQTRILRHDMRHYATMVKQYASMGEMEKVVAISEEIEGKNNAAIVKKFCLNPWVNLLLNTYMVQLEGIGVSPQMEIAVPEELPIGEMDFCVILGNVLDNATRSISGCKEAHFCSVLLCYEQGMLYLEVKNSCETPVVFRDGIPVSDRSGHGYGCKSIVYLAEKYHGLCSFELQNNIFTTQVILHE